MASAAPATENPSSSTSHKTSKVSSSSNAAVMAKSASLKMTGPMSRFCDYFVTCGLDYNSGLEALPTYEIDGSSKSFRKLYVYLNQYMYDLI
jgi:hypothetical protein